MVHPDVINMILAAVSVILAIWVVGKSTERGHGGKQCRHIVGGGKRRGLTRYGGLG
jgi:hypothetical protein